MCGIIACLKCGDTKNILLDGLKQLQNRGYDSCGIAIIQKNNFQIQKYASTNHKQSLEKLEEQYNLPKSHTTHPSYSPCYPFILFIHYSNCSFSISSRTYQ